MPSRTAKITNKTPLNRKELGEHVAKLISNERNSTHGDPSAQFMFAQMLKDRVLADEFGLPMIEKEALSMICVKISRILLGSNLQDHWLDIAGYALIAAEGAERPLIKETE